MATATKTKTKAPGEEKKTPFYKARMSAMQLAIWENRAVDTNGEERIYQTATLERGYTDKDGDWVNEKIRLNAKDFGAVIALMQNGQQALIKSE